MLQYIRFMHWNLLTINICFFSLTTCNVIVVVIWVGRVVSFCRSTINCIWARMVRIGWRLGLCGRVGGLLVLIRVGGPSMGSQGHDVKHYYGIWFSVVTFRSMPLSYTFHLKPFVPSYNFINYSFWPERKQPLLYFTFTVEFTISK